MRGHCGLPGFWFTHDEDERNDNGKYKSQDTEELNEGDHDSLLADHPGKRRIGALRGGCEIHASTDESASYLLKHGAGGRIECADVGAQNVVLHLSVAAQHRRDSRNPYTSTEIPHEIE